MFLGLSMTLLWQPILCNSSPSVPSQVAFRVFETFDCDCTANDGVL